MKVKANSPHACAGPARRPLAEEDIDWTPASRGFVLMLETYRPTGGTLRADDLVHLLEGQHQGDCSSLARLIVAGAVSGFKWHGDLWIPMFQFDLRDLSLKPSPGQVRAELGPAFYGWTAAAWFARRNRELAGQRPVNLLDTQLATVLEAARTACTQGVAAPRPGPA